MMHFKSALLATSALAVTASMASAGGIDRSRLPYAAMFEAGTYVELGFSSVNPNVTGAYVPPASALGASTGNMAESYTTLSLGLKTDINEKLSVGLFVNQPYGADAKYTAGFYTGLEAHWSSEQIAALVKYDVGNGFSVYGGAKHVTSEAQIAIPDRMIRASIGQAATQAATGAAAASAAGNVALATRLSTQATALGALATGAPAGSLAYTATSEKDAQTALIVGAAYEKPEIALRVALTYEQGFTHSFATRESSGALVLATLPTTVSTTTRVEMPKSLTLDFQSGIAKDTLLFGMVKYTEWSTWNVSPPAYTGTFNQSVTQIDNDVMTYQLGVGRRLNENLSVFGRVTYEEAKGGVASRLSPTDGSTSFGIGATYRKDNLKITGGIEYATLGEATDSSGTKFSGNDALGVGVQIGYSF